MSSTMSAPPLAQRSRPEQRGRAVAVLVLAVFALNWTSWGLSTGLPRGVAAPVLVLSGTCFVGLLAAGVRAHRRASRLPPGRDLPGGRAVGARFGVVVALEAVGLCVLALVLGRLGLVHLLPAAFCVGVGLHFFPLARLFHARLYDVTGLALCLLALATVVFAPLTGVAALWTAVPGLGAALTLYATCLLLLRGGPWTCAPTSSLPPGGWSGWWGSAGCTSRCATSRPTAVRRPGARCSSVPWTPSPSPPPWW